MILEITLITATGCKHCERMKMTILKYAQERNLSTQITEMNSEDEKAIDYAIDNGISDIPACVIAGKVIQGERFSEKDIQKAMLSCK